MNDYSAILSLSMPVEIRTLTVEDVLNEFDSRCNEYSDDYDPAVREKYLEFLSQSNNARDLLSWTEHAIQKYMEYVEIDMPELIENGIARTSLKQPLEDIKGDHENTPDEYEDWLDDSDYDQWDDEYEDGDN